VNACARPGAAVTALLLTLASPLSATAIKGVLTDEMMVPPSPTVASMLAETPRKTGLKGLICANEIGGDPVAGAQVSAISGANATTSKSNGTFTLWFDKDPGETVELIVQQPGMVVVNDYQLKVTLPKQPDATPLFVVLCKPNDKDTCLMKLLRVNRFDKVDKDTQKKLEDLKARNKADSAALKQLEAERDQARAEAQFAKEQMAQAKALGDTKLQPPSEAYVRAMQIASQAGIATTLISLGTLRKLENRTDEAAKAFADALEIRRKLVPENPTVYLPQVAETLTLLGSAWAELDRTPDAEKAYAEAVELRRKLAGDHPNEAIYLTPLASALNDLGTVLMKQKRIDEAKKKFEDALEVNRKVERMIASAQQVFAPRTTAPNR
jgi:hypothetical protein